MRQHLGHADGRFGGGLDRIGAPHPVGDLARLHDHKDEARHPDHRRDLDVALDRRPPARAHIGGVDEQRRLVGPHALERILERRVDRQGVEHRLAAQRPGRRVEEQFGGRVHLGDDVARIQQERRDRQRVPEGFTEMPHAASAMASQASGRSRRVCAGVGRSQHLAPQRRRACRRRPCTSPDACGSPVRPESGP